MLYFTGGTSINIPNGDCCAVAPDGLSDAFLRDGVKCRRFVCLFFVEPFIKVWVCLLAFGFASKLFLGLQIDFFKSNLHVNSFKRYFACLVLGIQLSLKFKRVSSKVRAQSKIDSIHFQQLKMKLWLDQFYFKKTYKKFVCI